jgi:putative hemolysin
MLRSKFLPLFLLLASANAFAWGGGSSVGTGNPADENCARLGGSIVNLKERDGGESPFCVFGKKGTIEVWTLFKEKPNKHSQAVEAYLEGRRGNVEHAPDSGMPNPASENCGDLGAKLKIMTDEKGNEWGICEFPDRSEIEEWTLYYGADSKFSADLAKVLNNL